MDGAIGREEIEARIAALIARVAAGRASDRDREELVRLQLAAEIAAAVPDRGQPASREAQR